MVTITVLFLLVSFAFSLDIFLILTGNETHFFDPDYIESYEEPMFEDTYDELVKNYDQYSEEIAIVGRELSFLPDNKSLKVEYHKDGNASIAASYPGGYSFYGNIDYHETEHEEFIKKLGLSPKRLDRIKAKVFAANCISFEKEAGSRLGFIDEKKGTYYYRFRDETTRDINALLDSCLIENLNSKLLLEYKGFGRGPDCIINKNPEGYDDRGFIKKWYDLITKDGEKDKLLEKLKNPKLLQRDSITK